jgi:hypothetical protein
METIDIVDGGMSMTKEEKTVFDAKKAIICFEYVERIKSELIIAAKLLDEIGELESNIAAGAMKLMSSFLNMLLAEMKMAQSVLGLREFEEAGKKVIEAAERMREYKFIAAVRSISEATSQVTTSGQKAMQILREKKLI